MVSLIGSIIQWIPLTGRCVMPANETLVHGTYSSLAAFLDTLPLKSAQRLFHILYKDTLDWKFHLNQAYDIDQNIFDYFLWGRTPQGNDEPQNALVVAYQPPWILSQADFEEFVRCSAVRLGPWESHVS